MRKAALPAYNRLNRVVIGIWLLVNDNEKHEARNPKQSQMTEIQITKTVGFENMSIRILNLFRISIFEFRI